MATVLIYYGSSEGHTAKIARHICADLVQRSLDVEVVESPAAPSLPLSDYSAVLIGDSIHVGNYHRPVMKFIAKHAEVLAERPNGFFSVCLAAASEKPEEQAKAKGFVDQMMSQTRWRPDRVAVFAGLLAYSKYGLLKTWLMKRIAKSDLGDVDTSRDYEYTDWDGVDAFTEDFATNVRRVSAEAAGARSSA